MIHQSMGEVLTPFFSIEKNGVIRFFSVSDINRCSELKDGVDAQKAVNAPKAE